jgi:hypothetical protein
MPQLIMKLYRKGKYRACPQCSVVPEFSNPLSFNERDNKLM